MPKSKIFASFADAVADIPDGSVIGFGGFAVVGMPINLYGALTKQGAKWPHLRLERHPRRRHDARGRADDGMADPQRSGEEGDLLVHRANPRLAAARPHRICRQGPDRSRTGAARHPGRAHARRRRRHPGLLYARRGRHRTRRGARNPRLPRPRIPVGRSAAARLRVHPRLEGGRRRQPPLPPLAAQFQPADGDGRAGHDRRGRGRHPAQRRHRPRRCAPPRHLRPPPGQDSRHRPKAGGRCAPPKSRNWKPTRNAR